MIDSLREWLNAWFDLPWPSIFAFFGLVALISFTFIPHLGESWPGRLLKGVVHFCALGLQEVLGVSAERAARIDMHEQNQRRFDKVDAELGSVKSSVAGHVTDLNLHPKNR